MNVFWKTFFFKIEKIIFFLLRKILLVEILRNIIWSLFHVHFSCLWFCHSPPNPPTPYFKYPSLSSPQNFDFGFHIFRFHVFWILRFHFLRSRICLRILRFPSYFEILKCFLEIKKKKIETNCSDDLSLNYASSRTTPIKVE